MSLPVGANGDLANQLSGEFDGMEHGIVVGEPFACDVEGRAVVWAGARGGEPEGGIDSRVEIKQLKRDQTLVMIHAENGIVAPIGGWLEDGVSGVRSSENRGGSRVGGIELFDGGSDNALVFISKCAIFASGGVEPADGYFCCPAIFFAAEIF